MRFADDITDDEIDAYIATGEPLEVAGAFTIDARGAAFIESVDGDPHAVVGLSVPLVRKLVRSLGVEWTDALEPLTARAVGTTQRHPPFLSIRDNGPRATGP